MNTFQEDIKLAEKIALLVKENGGTTYFVGGYVRDKLLGFENKDIDIEIHGISKEKLENILDEVGDRMYYGESFGIYSLKNYNLDIAMPRTERASGNKHTDFDIDVDPFIGARKAAMRRDFTINSLMENVITGEIIDCFGGQIDLKNRIIRHINEYTFKEDALRVLRCAQFSARFKFNISLETICLCKSMNITFLPKERVFEELKKALLKSSQPSLFFEALRKMNQLDYWFLEIKKIIDIEQPVLYHQEGNVWNHTMMVLDKAVSYRDKVSNPLAFMLTCLVHDLGKIETTRNEDGKITSYGHAEAGESLIKSFISRLTNEKEIINYALSLTKLHMKPNILAREKSSIRATNKMFDQAIDKKGLIFLAISDDLGRITKEESRIVENEKFLLERLDIYNEYMSRPYITGKDLIEAGIKPGKNLKKILEYAHNFRLVGVEKEKAINQVIAYAKRINKENENL